MVGAVFAALGKDAGLGPGGIVARMPGGELNLGGISCVKIKDDDEVRERFQPGQRCCAKARAVQLDHSAHVSPIVIHGLRTPATHVAHRFK